MKEELSNKQATKHANMQYMYMDLRKASALEMVLLRLMFSKVILVYSLCLTTKMQEDQVRADF